MSEETRDDAIGRGEPGKIEAAPRVYSRTYSRTPAAGQVVKNGPGKLHGYVFFDQTAEGTALLFFDASGPLNVTEVSRTPMAHASSYDGAVGKVCVVMFPHPVTFNEGLVVTTLALGGAQFLGTNNYFTVVFE